MTIRIFHDFSRPILKNNVYEVVLKIRLHSVGKVKIAFTWLDFSKLYL